MKSTWPAVERDRGKSGMRRQKWGHLGSDARGAKAGEVGVSLVGVAASCARQAGVTRSEGKPQVGSTAALSLACAEIHVCTGTVLILLWACFRQSIQQRSARREWGTRVGSAAGAMAPRTGVDADDTRVQVDAPGVAFIISVLCTGEVCASHNGRCHPQRPWHNAVPPLSQWQAGCCQNSPAAPQLHTDTTRICLIPACS